MPGSRTSIRVLTSTTVDPDDDRALTNDAHVDSTASEARLDNNDDRATATAALEPGGATPPASLPRTGAAVANLLLLGLGLVLSGRLLQRRNRVTA